MAHANSPIELSKQIRTLFDTGALGAMPDRGLLDHFARGGETSEAAFATLVQRHGTMVLRVCRQLLADGHLAEDAFQITFLQLALRARTIRNPEALAGWLHRVARRVALRALAEIRRRMDHERAAAGQFAGPAENILERAELCAIVHEEIDRLRDSQRLPLLLCALEGVSHEEAAQRLRWPVGTVKSRLVRARRRLEGRLARRGLTPAVALAIGAAGESAQAAPVSAALATATTQAAVESAAIARGAAGSFAGALTTSSSLLVRTKLTDSLMTRAGLAAGAAIAACAAIGLIAMATIRLPGGDAPAGDRRFPDRRASEAPSSVALTKDFAKVSVADPGISVGQPAIAAQANEIPPVKVPDHRLSALGEQVARAIRQAVQFLIARQRPDGSWNDVDKESITGTTSLVTLALMAAGEKPDSLVVRKALGYLRGFGPDDLKSTYAISLQTQVFAAAEPERDRAWIAANVAWLERAQIPAGKPPLWPGSWTYSDEKRARPGDNSNSQFALQGLFAASEVGVPVNPVVWDLSRSHWERSQKRDGSWPYTPNAPASSASMTCAGVSSLVISGLGRSKGREFIEGELVNDCGKEADRSLQAGIDWLTAHFQIGQNFGSGRQWKFYYLYGLERASRFAGIRFFGDHDWYDLGATYLVRAQDQPAGYWQGALVESDRVLATSFALLFLTKGRTPVLINKLRHGPATDWDNDPDDIRNIVSIVSRDWKHALTWQIVDSKKATVADLLRAPILFMNGHNAPEMTAAEKKNLRDYVERGGFILAEACCSSADFDRGFRTLMEEVFPDKQNQLRSLVGDHPMWRARHLLNVDAHPLWGIDRGGRTAVIYSPADLSCYWNQSGRSPGIPAVIKAIRVGQNVIDYATGRALPPDKLSEP
jgi:RNA polymerase sigma factor (sigma-70 family)